MSLRILGCLTQRNIWPRAELAFQICQIIRERKLTQVKAAKLLGIKQPNVSALMKGHLDGFSAERLFRLSQ